MGTGGCYTGDDGVRSMVINLIGHRFRQGHIYLLHIKPAVRWTSPVNQVC